MKLLPLKILGLFIPIAMIGWAQETGQPVPVAPEAPASKPFPLEVAGYVGFRIQNDDSLQDHLFLRDYAASLFVSKTIGRWRFHSEFHATTEPEYDADGIHLFPRRPSLSVQLESGFVNYNQRDWLQVQAGFLFIPTYWRTHRYQSTTLTVDDPLMDQNIFPTALRGGAVYGDKYWGNSGVSYVAYGGVDQQDQFQEHIQVEKTERGRVIGGKVTFHAPSRQFFKTFDIAFHRLHRIGPENETYETYGLEAQLSKSRFEFLGEFAHSSEDIINGVRGHIRQGYYLQPSYRITPKLFAVLRHDQLNRDSRYLDQSHLVRQTAGLVYRPIPAVSLKIEGNRIEPRGSRAPSYYGVTTSLVWFFSLP